MSLEKYYAVALCRPGCGCVASSSQERRLDKVLFALVPTEKHKEPYFLCS